MMRFRYGVATLLLLVLAASPAAAQDEGGGGENRSETPGEALERSPSETRKARGHSFMNFAGGVYRVDESEGALEEPLPSGSEKQLREQGYEVVGGQEVDVIVDEEGQIYVDRPYHGVIPGIRNELREGQLEESRGDSRVLWVGFQPMAALSRVFWLLSDPAPSFHVDKVDDRTVRVELPGHDVRTRNTLRTLFTGRFASPIERVDARRTEDGVRYTIRLKRSTNYLYRFEKPFLYVDFERKQTTGSAEGGNGDGGRRGREGRGRGRRRGD